MSKRRVSFRICVAVLVTCCVASISAFPTFGPNPFSDLGSLLGLLGGAPISDKKNKVEGPQVEASITTLGSPYTQNFDSLVMSGTSSSVPSGWAFAESGTGANATYTGAAGTSGTGDTYSFGIDGTNPIEDRAFGTLRGTVVSTIGSSFTNNTGSAVTSLDISYAGEEWRLGTIGRTDQISFEYSTDATSLTTGTWTPVAALNFVTPNTAAPATNKDGNAVENRTLRSATISALNIPNGATFWIRWTDVDASGSDDGLAIDDFSLTANGTPPAPEMNVTGNSVSIADGDSTPSLADHTDFGNVSVGGSLVRTYTIQNSGTASLNLTGTPKVGIGGAHASDFSVSAIPSSPVAAAGSTTFQVTFTPSARGIRSAAVSVASDDSDENPYNFDIRGFGIAPQISVSSTLNFGDQAVGTSSSSINLQISNTGDAGQTLAISSLSITGANQSDFGHTATLPANIPAGSSINVPITFTPSASGARSATLTIGNNDPVNPSPTVSLSGNGTAPEMNVLGNSVSIADGDATPSTADHTDFGNVALGGNMVRTFTIQNTGTAALNLTSPNLVDILGPNSANFSLLVPPTTPVPPGGSTTFQISFSTISIGLHSATVFIPSNDSDEPIYDFAMRAVGIGSPIVLTNPASLVVDTMATLNGEANPRGDATTGWFRYSTTDPVTCNDSFGTRAPSSGGTSIGSGTISTGFFQQVLALTPGTTYYFCAIAENSVGKSFGTMRSFGTPSNPTGTGQASPDSVGPGANVTLTVNVTPGLNPPSAGIQVIADLTSIGGFAFQPLFDDGATGGDITAGDNIYTFATTVNLFATPGSKSIPFTVSDFLPRSSNGSISMTVSEPVPDISIEDPNSNVLVDDISIVDFGTETVLVPGSAKTFTVRNVGTTLNVNTTISVTGTNASDFVVNNTGMSPVIAPGGNTAFTVTFTPGATGSRSASLEIASDDPDENPFNIGLTGTGSATPTPTPTPSPSPTPTTLVVDNLTDNIALNACSAAPGDCSLRGAISVANDGDTITFAPGILLPEAPPTIELAGEIVITQDITVTGPGPGPGALTVQNTAAASATSRIFQIDSAATVTISGLTLTGGNITSGDGGAIFNLGNLALTNMAITGNSAGVTSANGGGGIANQGTITITSSTISGNAAMGGGGGLLMVNGGTAVISGSTFSTNTSSGGGAILSQAISLPASLTITNSTMSGNTGPPCSGVWNLGAMATATVTSSTITNNVAGNGSLCAFGPTTIRNTIVARNQNVATDADTSGAFISQGYNLIGNVGTATGFAGAGDQIGGGANPVIDPKLEPLASNGGPTQTHKPLNGSPGQDKGCAFGATLDQRAMSRTVDWPTIANGACGGTDIGAVELIMPTAADASISGRVILSSGRGIPNVTVIVRNMAGDNVGTAVTNTFGYFTIADLPSGAAYVVSVSARGYSFDPSSQAVTLEDDVSDLNFIARPSARKA